MDVALLSVVFLLALALIVLRFTTVLRQILDTLATDRRERARELDTAHAQAFQNSMAALEAINDRITASQTAMFSRTVDMVAGPQSSPAPPSDDPTLDNRPPWQPDDVFDYSSLGLDPTDNNLPDPPLEPDSNEHRAVMVPPGQGLIPGGGGPPPSNPLPHL